MNYSRPKDDDLGSLHVDARGILINNMEVENGFSVYKVNCITGDDFFGIYFNFNFKYMTPFMRW